MQPMTNAEREHMARVAALGCVVCRNLGLGPTPAEVHHPLKNGKRIGYKVTIPLCTLHHRSGVKNEIHVSRHPWRKAFESRYGTEQQLLEQTQRELA
jgi:hypothetical protein